MNPPVEAGFRFERAGVSEEPHHKGTKTQRYLWKLRVFVSARWSGRRFHFSDPNGVEKVAPLKYDRIYSHFTGLVISQDAKPAVQRSLERYKKAIGDHRQSDD